MSNNVTPDSWETQADTSPSEENPSDPSAQFSTLNVNAAEFVPSFSFNSPGDEENKSDNKEESPVDTNTPAPAMSGTFLLHIRSLLTQHLEIG